MFEEKGRKNNIYCYNCFNPLNPEFMKWNFPSLKINMSIVANRGVSQNHKKMANSVDPDETAPYEPSHQDLYCLQ